MLHLANVGLGEVAAILAVVGALMTGFAMVRKLGPERDSLFITQAQGATVILDNTVTMLREEVDRCRSEIAVLIGEKQELMDENEALRAEAAGLRRASGRRRADGDG